jgi:hypothetical protein
MTNPTRDREPLWIAVRAWTQPTAPSPSKAAATGGARRRTKLRRLPLEVLVFDTETLHEVGQRVMVGVWRLYSDDPDGAEAMTCIEEGLFYPDDLPTRDPDGWAILRHYAESARASTAAGFDRGVKLWPLTRWLEERLYRYGYRHGDRCKVVGFNLPFDFGAIAGYYSTARGGKSPSGVKGQPRSSAFMGGWSLAFWGHPTPNSGWKDVPYHPRLRMKSIDPRRTLISWANVGQSDGEHHQGQFVDLRTLTFALTDRSFSLETACRAFGDDFEKADVEYGLISEEMLRYARADVAHTAHLYRLCLDELDRHPGIDLQPHRLYSPASVGTAYLKAMGVAEPLRQHADSEAMSPSVLGQVMSAFFGGRAEARIVRTEVPVVVADYTSMYPAQSALLDVWPLLTAESLNLDDVTDHVRHLVADPTLPSRLLSADTWCSDIGVTFVQLDQIGGAVLPIRGVYEPPPAGMHVGNGPYNIGINPLSYDGTLWYGLPDVLAATLLGPSAFMIRSAYRLQPAGMQAGLAAVDLRGATTVDPTLQNPFVAMIEARHTAKADTDLSDTERARLDLFLKITANATSYGSLARFDRRDIAGAVDVAVSGPMADPISATAQHPEDPGPYAFPHVAAAITAGARLLLALVEHEITKAGGSYAFMDTDSVAIVATTTGGDINCPNVNGDTIHALSHADVLNLLRRFTELNPFGDAVHNTQPGLAGCPWKIEKNSIDDPLLCQVIAAKRYALYRNRTASPNAVIEAEDIVSWSEHGLGLYQDPTPGHTTPDGKREWMRNVWLHILNRRLEQAGEVAPALNCYAITRFTISSPDMLTWFSQADHGQIRADLLRPGSFGMIAHPDALLNDIDAPRPAAHYSSDPAEWGNLDWYDRHTGTPLTVCAVDFSDSDAVAVARRRGDVLIQTLRDVIDSYPLRPEHKSLGPSGEPANSRTTGKLTRRPVQSAPHLTNLIGKEGNKITERTTRVDLSPDHTNLYGTVGDEWTQLVLPVLRQLGPTRVSKEIGVSARQVGRWLHNGDRPQQRHQQAATDLSRRVKDPG